MQGGKSLGRVLAVVLSLLRHSDGWQCQGFVPKSLTQNRHQWMQLAAEPGDDAISSSNTSGRSQRRRTYDLGIGQNPPLRRKANEEETSSPPENPTKYWLSPKPVHRPRLATANATNTARPTLQTRRVLQTTTNQLDSKLINSALYNLEHFQPQKQENARPIYTRTAALPERPRAYYPDIDLSIPDTVYTQDGEIDLVWDLLRWEAYEQAQREPLLVSFLHSTILNHPSLESSLAFLLANRLQSPAMMISTQLQSLILEALEGNAIFRRFLRADIMAVRDRDPACNSLPDVFLYFKGFHALQSHRVAHCLWHNDKQVLALFLQSQVSQIFQIDIHPNATLGSGILVDHGTGVVIGSTASVGHNCSILHHVTLGGSGKKGVDRHPCIGNGVLLGAGATVLGRVQIGDGCQIGAGTLVISDLPPHSVAVGVPARIIGSFVDVTEQPSLVMNQLMDDRQKVTFERGTFESEGI